MQRVNPALPAAFRQWAKGRECRIRLPPALLRPSHQKRLQQRGKPLIRQAAETLLSTFIPPGLRILPGEQHGGQGFIRNNPRKPCRFRTAIQQRRNKGALHHFRLIRITPERLQQAIGGVFRIGFIGGVTPGQIGTESAGHFRRGAAQGGAFHPFPGSTGGKQRGGKQPKAAGGEDGCHACYLNLHPCQTKGPGDQKTARLALRRLIPG